MLFIAAVPVTCDLGPPWLLWLCVVFGVLFLLMLCVNIFLCSAMTCSLSKQTLETDEKAGSVFTVQVINPSQLEMRRLLPAPSFK